MKLPRQDPACMQAFKSYKEAMCVYLSAFFSIYKEPKNEEAQEAYNLARNRLDKAKEYLESLEKDFYERHSNEKTKEKKT